VPVPAPVPVGRLWVDRRERSIHVLDITLLPEFRGQGLGTACLCRLTTEASARQVPLTVKVEFFNPARRWYERLGFVPQGEHGMHVQMSWTAPGAVVTLETEHEQA
jgi:ribosomal protein S18 acetylase RimI-like enzyme